MVIEYFEWCFCGILDLWHSTFWWLSQPICFKIKEKSLLLQSHQGGTRDGPNLSSMLFGIYNYESESIVETKMLCPSSLFLLFFDDLSFYLILVAEQIGSTKQNQA